MKITVLGCGRWGSFHAWYADHIGHDVTLWAVPVPSTYRNLWTPARMNTCTCPIL